jgi:hypothetical protein
VTIIKTLNAFESTLLLKVTAVMTFLIGVIVIPVEVYQESSSKETKAELPE